LNNANLVENYPGFPDGISGRELALLFQRQLENSGVNVINENIVNLDFVSEQNVFILKTKSQEFKAKRTIIASGTIPKTLEQDKYSCFPKDRIFYEIHEHADIYKSKIAIIGAGDAAFDYALNFAAGKNQLIILNRSSKIKCLPLLWERCKQVKNIKYIENIHVQNILESDKELKLVCENSAKELIEISANYLLVAIGRQPSLDFLGQNLIEKQKKLIETNLLFIIGDVKNNIYRQSSICVGEGVRTAMEIARLI